MSESGPAFSIPFVPLRAAEHEQSLARGDAAEVAAAGHREGATASRSQGPLRESFDYIVAGIALDGDRDGAHKDDGNGGHTVGNREQSQAESSQRPSPQFRTARAAANVSDAQPRATASFTVQAPAVQSRAAQSSARPPSAASSFAPTLTTRPSTRPLTGEFAKDESPTHDTQVDTRWLEFGPLAPYLAADRVTDVFVNGDAGLWVDDGTALLRQSSWQVDERSLRELAVRLISLGGRHIDEATPCVDVRLADGMRVHAVLPPVSTTGTLLSIRVPRRARFRLSELAAAGMLTPEQLARVLRAIAGRENLLICGAGGSGKTTLLSAMLGDAPPHERIVTIEDVAELRIEHPHVVALEARQSNLEGAGEIGMARLVREALRMRPDRLVVGECRGGEIRELLAALNTGHDGGAGTLHANSLGDVPARIEALGALAGMSQEAVARQTVSAIGLVLQLERVGGIRSLAQIGRFRVDEHGHLAVTEEAPS